MIWVTKRDGRRQKFNKQKITSSILRAFKQVEGTCNQYAIQKADTIAEYIEGIAQKERLSVERVQDYVENGLMNLKNKDVAKAYIKFRDDRTRLRGNSIDKSIREIVEGANEYWNTENSNKNAKLASTQRDYMAGQVSQDISRRELLPTDVVEAHDEGLIHFHDIDYFAQHIHNCCLVNLEDMLQNGTVINSTLIEKPHSFLTACNIATQIVAVVASGQFGGQTISLSHLAPFVNESRIKHRKEVREQLADVILSEEKLNDIAEQRLMKEIKDGVQTIQYQINTLNTSNGQTPFVTVFMYLGEVSDEQTKHDLALIIEEVLKQRYVGTKNEAGVYITPAFPKLIYTLEEDNIKEGSKYYYLTELAAKCSAKRLVPDYISEKKMKELKSGDVYPCMGCRSFLTPDRFTDKGIGNIANAKNYESEVHKYYGRLTHPIRATLNSVNA